MSTHPFDVFLELQEQQNGQDSIFQPTTFWERATDELIECLREDNIQDFRRDAACLSYFVPTYGYPGLGLSSDLHYALSNMAKESKTDKHKLIIESFLSGHHHALADFKAIKSACDSSKNYVFDKFQESVIGSPIEQFALGNTLVSRASQNYMLGLLFILRHDPEANFTNVIEIGGGYGALAELLFKSSLETSTFINFDINPTCIFADFYLSKAIPKYLAGSVQHEWPQKVDLNSLSGAFIRPNWDVTKLEGTIDLFVNFHSFQEMEPAVTRRYIQEMKRWEPQYLLLRNIKEGKQLATDVSVGVDTPITSQDYESWLQDEYSLIDKDSLIYGFVTADGFHSEISLWRRK